MRSDIHLEPNERALIVRYRIDGVLHQVMQSPKNIQSGVISRLKIMADINIAERRIPKTVGCRSTPTARRSTFALPRCQRCGAKRSSCVSWTTRRRAWTLSDLGFSQHNYETFSESFASRTG